MAEHDCGVAERIRATVASWDGVEVSPHRFDGEGGVENVIELFRLSYERADGARRRTRAREPVGG